MPNASQATRERRIDAGVAVVIAAMAVKLLYGFEHVRDILLDDETICLASGVGLFHAGFPNEANGLPRAEGGPLYSVWYWLLSMLIHDRVILYYASHLLVCGMLILGLFAAFRAFEVGRIVALVICFALLTSRYFDIWPYMTYLTTVFLLAGVAAAMWAPSTPRAARSLVWGFSAASFVRPELCAAVLAIGAVFAGAGVAAVRRGRMTWRALTRECAISAAPFLVLVAVFGSPLGGTRLFYAFAQHYALNEVDRTHVDMNPWTNWERFVKQDFGDVNTVSGALRANPATFTRHVLVNLLHVSRTLCDVLEPSLDLPPLATHVLHLAYLSFALAAFFALIEGMARWRRASPNRQLQYVAFGALLATTLLSSLVIYPRAHYFLPVLGVGLALGVAEMPWARARRTSWRGEVGLALASAAALVLTPSLAYGLTPQHALAERAAKAAGAPPPPPDVHHLATIAELRELGIHRQIVTLEPGWGFCYLAGIPFERVAPWDKHEPFADLLASRKNRPRHHRRVAHDRHALPRRPAVPRVPRPPRALRLPDDRRARHDRAHRRPFELEVPSLHHGAARSCRSQTWTCPNRAVSR